MLYFFLSYARGDEDDLVRQFYDDLSVEVRVRAGLSRDAEVGFIDARMKAGTVWSAELAEALSQCRNFVALLSPRYFQSRACGQEWQIFADRVARYEEEKGVDPAVLRPLLWVPLPPATIHPVAARLQFSSDLLGDTCVRQLMRLRRHQDAYREFVFELAGQIVESAETHPIPEGHGYRELDRVPSAFQAQPPVSGGPPVDRFDPLTVHFVVAAPTRAQALSVRSDRAFYGDRPRDWAPYSPARSSPLAEYASGIAESRSLSSRVADLAELPDLASRDNQIVVLLVDAWVTELEEASQALAAYNARDTTTAVLIPRSLDDRETVEHWRRLSEECRRIFRRTADDEELYRSNIPTYQAFEHDLAAVLEVAVNRMFVSGHIQRRSTASVETLGEGVLVGPGGGGPPPERPHATRAGGGTSGGTGGGPPPRVRETLRTPVGPVYRYPVGDFDYVLVDANEGGTVVSWTGTCDAVAFVGLCRRLADRIPTAEATAAIGGERLTGPATDVLRSLIRAGAPEIRKSCVFIRVDTPDLDVAYHRMPDGQPPRPLVVISGVSDGPFGADLHDLARQTASGAVADCVRDVAPTA